MVAPAAPSPTFSDILPAVRETQSKWSKSGWPLPSSCKWARNAVACTTVRSSIVPLVVSLSWDCRRSHRYKADRTSPELGSQELGGQAVLVQHQSEFLLIGSKVGWFS